MVGLPKIQVRLSIAPIALIRTVLNCHVLYADNHGRTQVSHSSPESPIAPVPRVHLQPRHVGIARGTRSSLDRRGSGGKKGLRFLG